MPVRTLPVTTSPAGNHPRLGGGHHAGKVITSYHITTLESLAGRSPIPCHSGEVIFHILEKIFMWVRTGRNYEPS